MPGPCGRFSFIGDSAGPLGAAVTYEVGERQVRVKQGDKLEILDESIFDYLDRQLRRRRHPSAGLPFDFNGGFVGYFGYEMKVECGGASAHASPLPDAAFVFAGRLVAFDHVEGCAWLVALADEEDAAAAERWLDETQARLASLHSLPAPWPRQGDGPIEFRFRRSRGRYLRDIDDCRDRLVAGETYEVCLTNKVAATYPGDALGLYLKLRRVNPAPFAAFLRFGDTAILSSSPERFLRVGADGWVEAKPIKGTRRRGVTPTEDARLARSLQSDGKSRAENVTIVDLLRNDLGIVCEFGTVSVAELMAVETYETVHQLVSTVRGRLRRDVTGPDCIRACFPPGSMTGAPKLRTMEIIDGLEAEARGPYSGAIGYLAVGGACDLSVAIRAIVLDGDAATIGCGGAIVLDSNPEDEYEEMRLKAWAPMRAIDPGLSSISGDRPPLFVAGLPPAAVHR